MPIRDESDVVMARKHGRDLAEREGWPQKAIESLATAIAEVAHNIVEHAATGEIVLEVINDKGRRGVMVTARDNGPGIGKPHQAMQNGFSSKHGLGLGLSSAQRLMDEFQLDSAIGRGTTVIMKKFRS